MEFTIPAYVSKVLNLLTSAGFEAYVVGGAVRDLQLGREPDDFDITTNARPDEIRVVGERAGLKVVEVGKAFGVIILVVDKQEVEVASFRNEVYGKDSHRPEEVWYCETLEEDLSRRDFTINAMALDKDGKIIDPHGGLDDLKSKVLRTVGDPNRRFEEDALRMFRACRFVSQLGFTPEMPMVNAIRNNLRRIRGLSLERVKTELDKLLCGAYAKYGMMMLVGTGIAAESCRIRKDGKYEEIPILKELNNIVNVPQNPAHHKYDVWGHTLEALANGDRSLTVQWAILLHDIAKGQPGIRGFDDEGQPTDHGHEAASAEMAKTIMERLQYPTAMVHDVHWLIDNHMRFGTYLTREDAVTLRWLRKTARDKVFKSTKEMAEGFKKLYAVCVADMSACNIHAEELLATQNYGRKLIRWAYEMPVHTSDLFISGDSLAEIVTDRKELGELMQVLLRRVQDGNLPNDEDALLAAAQKWLEKKA